MKKLAKWALPLLAVVVVAIQLIPVDRSNPAVETEVPASSEVRAVLRRACYDCHSNETVWPWYSRVAPASWLVVRDVRLGREAVNYSTWNRVDAKKQLESLQESWEEVSEGEMPPRTYLLLHPEARLSANDRSLLQAWAPPKGTGESDDD